MLPLWLLHQLQPSQLSPVVGGRKAPGGGKGRGWGVPGDGLRWRGPGRKELVSMCQPALHPCLCPRELPGVTLPSLAPQPSSPDTRIVLLGPITSSCRGNDLIKRTAAETETPGDGFGNITVIFMQMSSVVKKERGEESTEKTDVSAELFLYRIFFKDFNKATAAFEKGSMNKENTAASSFMKGKRLGMWLSISAGRGVKHQGQIGADNVRIFLQIFGGSD